MVRAMDQPAGQALSVMGRRLLSASTRTPRTGNRTVGLTPHGPASRYALLLSAVMLFGCTEGSPRATAAGPPAAAEVVRSYVAATERGDAETVCRLSLPEDGISVQDCVVSLRAAFDHPGLAKSRWRELGVGDVRADRRGRFLRARVLVRYVRPVDGRRRSRWDTWWLRRRSGRLVVLKAGRFGARSLGYPPGVADADRPITPARASRTARLRPQVRCGRTRSARVLERDSVTSLADSEPVRAPWLDLVRIERAEAPGGRTCVRLHAAEGWRPATRVDLDVDTRSRRLVAALSVRIDGHGRVRRNRGSRGGRAGGDGEALTFVLARGRRAQGILAIDAAAISTQPSEPLLRDPINAADLARTVRLP